ncbi:MAG TPA: UbiX family flavin prenyltransferase [Anaerolineae bacterium]|nr:UbiX family flavin prenyltransferase [Anaerolineae bacterium]HQH37365.1 UbiX family flavin prenyltransferase [Anaerolineae bacterium]
MARIIIGITGASGAIYGIRALTALKTLGVETHLVVTPAGLATLHQELQLAPADLPTLATRVYDLQDFAAPIASGTFATQGMMVAPCSMKTLSAIANSYADNLLVRAADVTLKEGRPLLLAVRETPLHLGHLRLLVQAAEIGAIIFPPVPAFYPHPTTLDEMVDQTVGRMLARLGMANDLYRPWGE